jgi:hypothetical protein
VTADAGCQLSRRWRLKVDLLNVFNSKNSDIDDFYTSRLGSEPLVGRNDIHFHTVEPFTWRIALVAAF